MLDLDYIKAFSKELNRKPIAITFTTGETRLFSNPVIVNKKCIKTIEVDPKQVDLKHIGQELIGIRYKDE